MTRIFFSSVLIGLSAFASIWCGAPARAQTPAQNIDSIPWYLRQSATEFPDRKPFTSLRFDKLEWGGPNTGSSARWDMEAFVGTDYDKLFFKSEGFYNGKTRTIEEGQFQVLYSRLISYYFDAQLGIRQDFSKKSNRTYAVIGVEGLAPGFIEIDADAFVSQKGEVSSEITAFYDLLITNRLILQPRIDVKLQMQSVPDLEVGAGLTDFELGARLRYEFTRNFAPYVGVNWDRKVGQTATIARINGEAVSNVSFIAGVRLFW